MYDSEEDAILVGPDDVQDFNTDNVLPLSPAKLVDIKKWLQPTPYDLEKGEFRRHLSSHLTGTGSWLTSTEVYRQWHESDENGILWIKGIPGSGKSVMAASLIDQLGKDGSPVVYFFFRQIIEANHKPAAALRDWLDQLLYRSPPLQARLENYVKRNRDIESLSMSDLWKDLRLVLSSFSKVYCVVDALDEMDQGNDDFMLELAELGRWRPSNVKVLITSRPVATVENILRSISIPQIRLEERLVDVDIATYVQKRLEKSSVPQEFHSIVKEAVPGRANGLFLYAKLAMDAFAEPGADAREVLKTLPTDLNVMYTGLLREHARRSQVPHNIQLLILQFVTHATRPLRLLEIAEMADKTIYRDEDKRQLKEIKDLVRAACGPLIEILPDETVSVVHHSFTEFLKGYTRSTNPLNSDVDEFIILQPGPTNKDLATTCLAYLESGCLDNWNPKKRTEERQFFEPVDTAKIGLRLQHPFLEYSAENWHIHIRRAALAGAQMTDIYQRLDRFFENEQRIRALLDIDQQESAIQNVTPLHIAARTGLIQYVAHLLSREIFDINTKDIRQKTPLFWAAFSGHADIVQLLLDEGALPDEDDHVGLKPLHVAASNNHGDVIRILLRAGVDPLTSRTKESGPRPCGNAPTSIGHTPLMYACENGHLDAVSAFLEIINDVDIVHRALSWAAKNGHSELVARILQYPGVNVDAKYMGDTALFVACASGDEKTIAALISAGADPTLYSSNAVDEFDGMQMLIPFDEFSPASEKGNKPLRGFTALHALCGLPPNRRRCKISKKSAKLLLQAGADVHQQAPDGSTALHYASKHENELIEPLITAGADPNMADDKGNTPLHVVESTHENVLSLLFGRSDVDINKPRTSDGKSPLLCRLASYDQKSALAILAYGPDIHATDFEGNGPLHTILAKYYPDKQVLEKLLAAGANPNLKNRKGRTPLHVMEDGSPDFIDTLLNAGADLEVRDNEGRTVLSQAINVSQKHGEELGDIIKRFLARGARLDARDFKGRTMLHEAVRREKNLVSDLLSLGLDPNMTDYEGNTLFHEMITTEGMPSNESYASWTNEIRRWGLDTDRANNHGRNALHMVCTRTFQDEIYRTGMARIDFVLGLCKHVDHADNQGIRPLHLAATISEFYVCRLLAAGADIFGSTYEGMTALHLSARACQSNIVGLILRESLKMGVEERMKFINQQDHDGQTALHYACRSGRPETVKLLLEAGANPNLRDILEHSPLEACAEFDKEMNLWTEYSERDTRHTTLYAAGTTIDDKTRPFYEVFPNHQRRQWFTGSQRIPLHLSTMFQGCIETERDTVRLDEILDLLVKHGAEVDGDESPLLHAIVAASSTKSEYSLECLLKLQSKINQENLDEIFGTKNFAILHSKYRSEAKRNAILEGQEFKSALSQNCKHVSEMILLLREYNILEELASKGLDLQKPDYYGRSVLHSLSRWGYASLLERLCTPEAAQNFDDHEWWNNTEQDSNRSCLEGSIKPLLLTACERTLPNMEVVKILAEKMNVSLDAHARCQVDYKTVVSRGCLHQLALGEHWWQVEQALPYFIQKGADLEIRDEKGATPLHKALSSKEPFAKIAARRLIEAGADVNAVSNDGDTCLSKAGSDVELIQLLISRGAEVTAPAVFSAISLKQPEILQALLVQGSHANLRRARTKESVDSHRHNIFRDTEDHEIYPLQYAASLEPRGARGRIPDAEIAAHKSVQALLMKILLENGADLYAEFFKSVPDLDADNDSSSEELDDEWTFYGTRVPKKWKKERHTVSHEIIKSNICVQPLLDLPSLEIERRDASGCTLLLAACKAQRGLAAFMDDGISSKHAVFRALCERGADLTACDNEGRNILHHLSRLNDCEFLRHAVSLVPGLLKQADHAGNTPFHYVLQAGKLPVIELFFEQGGDPLQPDSDGNTALHCLASRSESMTSSNAKKLFLAFLQLGIPINSQNHQGDTPLCAFVKHKLVEWCNLQRWEEKERVMESMLILINQFRDAGADVFARDYAGSTLLHVVASLKVKPDRPFDDGKSEAGLMVMWFKHLMELGLDPMAEDNSQRTSLDVAAACGNEHILKLFERKALDD